MMDDRGNSSLHDNNDLVILILKLHGPDWPNSEKIHFNRKYYLDILRTYC